MDEQTFKRFEDKQKFANFEIEKRFVKLEAILDEMKSSLEKESVIENVPKEIDDVENKLNNIKNEMSSLREEKRKDLEQITALVDSVDVTPLKNEIEELKKNHNAFVQRFEEELRGIRMIEERLLIGRNDEKTQQLFMKTKELQAKLDMLSVRFSSFENKKLLEPIFIE